MSALLPAAAWADPPSKAEVFFSKGAEHFDARRYDQACPLLEESYRLDPQGGALFMLAQCEEARGHIATALARFQEYATFYERLTPAKRARQGDRERQARAAQTRLAPEVPMLTLELPPTAPSGTVVKRNGRKVDPATLGTAQPEDPGEYLITTQTPDGAVSKAWITLDKRDKRGLVLTIPRPAVPEPLAAPPITPRPRIAEPSPPPTEASRGRVRVIGSGIGIAVVGLGTGVGLTLASSAQGASADRRSFSLVHDPGYAYACAPSPAQIISQTNAPLCDELARQRGLQRDLFRGAIAGYIVGGVAAVSTAVLALWPTIYRPQNKAAVLPSLGLGGGGMTIVGSF